MSHPQDTIKRQLSASIGVDELNTSLKGNVPQFHEQKASIVENAIDGKVKSASSKMRDASGQRRQTVALDFGSKGLTDVEFKDIGEDEGPEARLHGTALYSPVPGWPTGYGQHDAQDIEGVVYPVRVNFRIALTNKPGGELVSSISTLWKRQVTAKILPTAVEVLRRNTKIYLDIRDHGYEWHEKFIAMWNVAGEGVWAVSLNHDPISLPSYWAANVKPAIDASEAKWKANHRNERVDGSPHCPKPRLAQSSSVDEQLVSCREFRPESGRSGQPVPSDGMATLPGLLSPRSTKPGTPSRGENGQQIDLSELQEELLAVADDLGDSDSKGARQIPDCQMPPQEISRVDEIALAGAAISTQASTNGDEAASMHRWRRTSEEQDELDRLEVERGWLPAVNLLIQMADCLLVSLAVSVVSALIDIWTSRLFTNADCLWSSVDQSTLPSILEHTKPSRQPSLKSNLCRSIWSEHRQLYH